MNSFDSMEHRLQITGVREHEMPSNNLSSIGKKVLQFVPYPFLVLSTGGIIHLCNDEFISLSGYGAEEIQGLNLFDLLKTKPDKIWQEFIDSNDAIKQFSASLITKARGCIAMQWTINRDDTEKVFFCSGRTVFTSLAWIEDSSLTPEATTENHLLLEQAIFEMNMKRHVTTGEVTDRLLTGIERLYPGAACSILKLHPDNSLHAYSAPSLPKEYIEQINGTIAAAGIGSCGTAAVTGKAVIVSNIDENPLWQTARPVAARFGLKACWSVPIHRSNGRVLGTFAIYYRMPKTPTATMLRHMQRWAHLSGILIENNEMVDDLRLLNERHNLAAKATHDMLWDWDLETNIIFRHQDGLRAIYGHSNNDAIRKVSDWTGRIHPNDRARVLRQIERIPRYKSTELFKAEYRFLREDDTYVHIYDRGYIIRDDTGKPIRLIGAAQDITDRKIAEKKLRDSEEQYRYFFHRNPLPMWIFDLETHCFMEVNERAVEHYGYSEAEFYALSIYDIWLPEDNAQLLFALMNKRKPDHMYSRASWKHRKKSGEVIHVEVFSHKINYEGKQALLMLSSDITRNIELQNQLAKEKIDRQRKILKSTIAIQEKERREIGHELHDNVNQILGAAKLYLESLPDAKDKQEEYRLEGISLVLKAIEEIRKLTHSLAPPRLEDIGLIISVNDLIMSIQKVQPLHINFTQQDLQDELLDRGLCLALYRIIQEQITNILKYASASEVKIHLEQNEKGVKLDITDNGVGFDQSTNRKGSGFTNIRNRSQAYNGKVAIDASPGNGCSLHVFLRHPVLDS